MEYIYVAAIMFLRIGLGHVARVPPSVTVHIYLILCGMPLFAFDYTDDFEAPTYFIPQPNNFTYTVGQTATLLCSTENLGQKSIVWRKSSDPHPISIDEIIFPKDTRYNVEISKERKEYNLIIENVQPNDNGVYVCQVSSREQLIHPVLLKVIEQPYGIENNVNRKAQTRIPSYAIPAMNNEQDILVTQPDIYKIVITGNEFVNSGETIKLMCNVTGVTDIPQDIDWFKDGHPLRTAASSKIIIQKDSSIANRKLDSVLQVKNSKIDDSGIYVCRNSETVIASQKVMVLKETKSNPGKRGTARETKSRQTRNRPLCALLLFAFLSLLSADGILYIQ